MEVDKIESTDNKSPMVFLEARDGVIEIEYSVFKNYTSIIKSPDVSICESTTITTNSSDAKDSDEIHDIHIDLSKYDVQRSTVELLCKYMVNHMDNIIRERIPMDVPLVSGVLKKIYKTDVDIRFFEHINDNIELICEFIGLTCLLKCDHINDKVSALFTTHLKRAINIKLGTLDKTPLDILRKKLSGF